jgi:hypothetical protein
VIFVGYKFHPVIHRWLSPYTGKKNQNSYCMNRVTLRWLSQISWTFLFQFWCWKYVVSLYEDWASSKWYSTMTHRWLSRYCNLLSGDSLVTHMGASVLRHKTFRREQKIRIYNTLSLPILLWGNGTWAAKAEIKFMGRTGLHMERL